MLHWILWPSVGLVLLIGAVLIGLRLRFKKRAIELWLRADTQSDLDERNFQPKLVEDLPEPMRRYFLHALAPGSPLGGRVEIQGQGEIFLRGKFQAFSFRELIAPKRGFVWKANAKQLRLSVVDHYLDDEGALAGLLFGCIPTANASGADVSRSARHRLAAEQVWYPAGLLPQRGVSWKRMSDTQARAKLLIDEEPIDLILTIGPEGQLEQAEMRRWSNEPKGSKWHFRDYVIRVQEQASFSGRTIPTLLTAGYLATDGTGRLEASIKVTVTQAVYH